MLNIPTLREKAITVRVRRSMYTPTKYDKAATAAAEAALGTAKTGRYTKKLLRACKELRDCQHAFQDVYNYAVQNTLPWMDEGVRVLPNDNYIEFAAEIGRLRNVAMQKVQALAMVWDTAVMADKGFLGGMWDPHDYPTKSEMVNKWDIRIMFSPVATSEDFRIDMDESDKALLDQAIKDVEEQATDYLLKQILEPVAAMSAKLAVPIGEEGAVFRDTLVGNLRDVCKRTKKLNINNDERVDEVVDEIEHALVSITPQTLRESDYVRATTAKRMDEISKKLNQWF